MKSLFTYIQKKYASVEDRERYISSASEMNTICLINDLPDDVIERILMCLPGSFVVKIGSLVCKRWLSIINSDLFWVEKSIYEKAFNRAIITYFHEKGIYDIKQLYFKNPFDRNLIKNPCGNEGFTGWTFSDNHSRYIYDKNKINFHDTWKLQEKSKNKSERIQLMENFGFLIENPPVGSKKYSINNVDVNVFATTYNMCKKFQIIDLAHEGFSVELLNKIKPRIEVVDHYAARFDCSSQYRCLVVLLDSSFNKIDEIEFTDVIPQWNDSEWHEWKHIFEKIPENIGYIFFYHEGKDCQFWAGHYGIKMTDTSVRLLFA